jgi:hypothetical protein
MKIATTALRRSPASPSPPLPNPPVVGKLRRLGINAGRKPREAGGVRGGDPV